MEMNLNEMIAEIYGSAAVGSTYVVLAGREMNTQETFFSSREEAMRFADLEWHYLTPAERKMQKVDAHRIEWEIFDGMAVYEAQRVVWSSTVEGAENVSRATSALIHIEARDSKTQIYYSEEELSRFGPWIVFDAARSRQEENPDAKITLEFFEDLGDDEFEQLAEVVLE